MYNGNYEVASLVYIYNVYVCSKTIFSPVMFEGLLYTVHTPGEKHANYPI